MCGGKSFSSYSAGRLLCFLQTILVLLQLITCAAATNKQAYCAPSSCGEITNISHPFRLKNDPATCGDPRYELACENNRAVLSLFSGKYYVRQIDYRNFTIRLLDPGIEEGDNCSSLPRYFLSPSNFTSSYTYDDSYDSEPFKIPGNPYQDVVIYLNCSNPVKDDPPYVDTSPCGVNWHSTGHLYAIAGDLPPENLKVGCRVKLVAMSSAFPLNSSSYWYYDHPPNHNFSYAEIHRMLIYGFDLSWLTIACEDSCGGGNRCNLDEATGHIECDYCTSPLGDKFRCEHLSKQRIYMEDIIYGIAKEILQIFGRKLDTASDQLSDTKLIEIGRVIGRYVLPFYTVRFTLGLMVFFVLLIYICRRRHKSMYVNIEDFLQGNTLMPIRYSFQEIKKMTKNFKHKLGEGGYGSVYKGKLRSGPFVAIKMLGKPKANGQEFISEVATIGRIHHSNVVRLIGFCAEASKRALVYEFMPNGSLDRYILSSKKDVIFITCEQMYEISLGVARGIAYLHQGCDMQILHFDIKPHNILLDENFVPKVSDFGLAKLYPNDNSIVTLTAARGTIGYMAPELFYKNIGGVSYKADVYSFGMLLMEMASKRRNLNPHADRSSQLFFPFWIYNQLTEEREIEMEEITDDEKNNVKKMFMVALWCIQLKPSDRPSMNNVIEMLEGDIQNIEMPPKPSLYPNETIQGDLEINSDEIVSDVAASSVSFLEETNTEPLLKYSA